MIKRNKFKKFRYIETEIKQPSKRFNVNLINLIIIISLLISVVCFTLYFLDYGVNNIDVRSQINNNENINELNNINKSYQIIDYDKNNTNKDIEDMINKSKIDRSKYKIMIKKG